LRPGAPARGNRLNFQFGTELAYEIPGGKLGRMLRNATYTGVTPQFWGSCDAICRAHGERLVKPLSERELEGLWLLNTVIA
jgi:hypothetical protein